MRLFYKTTELPTELVFGKATEKLKLYTKPLGSTVNVETNPSFLAKSLCVLRIVILHYMKIYIFYSKHTKSKKDGGDAA